MHGRSGIFVFSNVNVGLGYASIRDTVVAGLVRLIAELHRRKGKLNRTLTEIFSLKIVTGFEL